MLRTDGHPTVPFCLSFVYSLKAVSKLHLCVAIIRDYLLRRNISHSKAQNYFYSAMPHYNQDSRTKIGKGMIYAAWIIALLMLTWLFDNYLEKQQNPNQIVIHETDANGKKRVKLQQNRQGHYIANGLINGQRVTFLLDTGATLISVPGNLARKLKLPTGSAHNVKTAAGNSIAYGTRLNSVQLGSIKLLDLKATIAPQMPGESVLLGMNFMRQLEMIQRNGQLTLIQH